MTCTTIYTNSTTTFAVKGLYDADVNAYVNDADVSVIIKDAEGATLVSSTPLDYVENSDGDYSVLLEAVDTDSDSGLAYVTASSGGFELSLEYGVEFVKLTAASMAWSSRRDLEMMFGRENVRTWADLENEGDADDIADRIEWAVDLATSDAKMRLAMSPCNVESLTCVPTSLRLNTTRLAGVLLYESRGIKDVSEDGEGRHRLTRHEKAALDFFRKVVAGQLILTANSSDMVPVVVSSDEADVEDISSGDEIML